MVFELISPEPYDKKFDKIAKRAMLKRRLGGHYLRKGVNKLVQSTGKCVDGLS